MLYGHGGGHLEKRLKINFTNNLIEKLILLRFTYGGGHDGGVHGGGHLKKI